MQQYKPLVKIESENKKDSTRVNEQIVVHLGDCTDITGPYIHAHTHTHTHTHTRNHTHTHTLSHPHLRKTPTPTLTLYLRHGARLEHSRMRNDAHHNIPRDARRRDAFFLHLFENAMRV
jgi:hypothetical protein